MSPQNPVPPPDFPAGDVLSRTFATTFSGAILGSRLFGTTLVWALVYAVVLAVSMRVFEMERSAIFLVLSSVPYTFLYAPLAVSVHRLVLLGEPLPSSLLSVLRAKDYALLGLMLSVPFLALSYLWQVSANAGQVAPTLVIGLLLLVGSLLAVRLFVALPYFALDEPHPVRTAWERTQGQWLKLMGLATVVGVVALAAVLFIGGMLLTLLSLIVGDNLLLLTFVLELTIAVIMAFSVVLTVALLTQIVRAVDPGAGRPPPSQKSD